MVACIKPQQWKKEENKRLREQIKFIDLRFPRGQVVGLSEDHGGL